MIGKSGTRWIIGYGQAAVQDIRLPGAQMRGTWGTQIQWVSSPFAGTWATRRKCTIAGVSLDSKKIHCGPGRPPYQAHRGTTPTHIL
jgi:hypothetical protein